MSIASEVASGAGAGGSRGLQVLGGGLEAGASIGWGVFTTGAIVGSRPALLARHLARLRRDAVRSRLIPEIPPEIPEDEDPKSWSSAWSSALEHEIAARSIERGLFRLTLCARGEGRWHPEDEPRATVTVAASELETPPIEAWLSPYHIDARRPLCGVKSTSYTPWHLMAMEARERGCGEAIYRDSTGALCEGARSNLFWRRGSTLFTPASGTGCLPGIARAMLISWLGEAASAWRLREVSEPAQSLADADEVMLSSSTLGPRAVSLLRSDDGSVLWRGEEGGACRQLRGRWQQEAVSSP